MTITETTGAESATAPTPALVDAAQLRDALSACLLSVIVPNGKTLPLPVLQAVRVHKMGSELRLRGTNRFVATQATITLDNPPEGDWDTLIPADDAKRIVSGLTKRRGAGFTAISPDSVGMLNGSMTRFRRPDGEWPDKGLDSILSGAADAPLEAVERVGLNPAYLAALAKMPGRAKNEPARFEFRGELRPVLVRWADGPVSYLNLIMPTRIND